MHEMGAMVRALETLHGCEVLVTVEATTGTYERNGILVYAVARFPPTAERTSARYCTESVIVYDLDASLPMIIYRVLLDLDVQIASMYQNKALWP